MNVISYANSIQKDIDKLEEQAASLVNKVQSIENVKETVLNLRDKLRYDVMVPYGPHAFYSGKLIHTNEFLVGVGENYRIEATAKQASNILNRRQFNVEHDLAEIKSQIKDCKSKLDVLNVNVRNEQGDDFFEIRQSLEESEQMLNNAISNKNPSHNFHVEENTKESSKHSLNEPEVTLVERVEEENEIALEYDELIRLEEEAERLGLNDEEAAEMVNNCRKEKKAFSLSSSPLPSTSRLSKSSFPDSFSSISTSNKTSTSMHPSGNISPQSDASPSSTSLKSKGFKKGFFGFTKAKPSAALKVSFASDVVREESLDHSKSQGLTSSTPPKSLTTPIKASPQEEDEPFNGMILERPSTSVLAPVQEFDFGSVSELKEELDLFSARNVGSVSTWTSGEGVSISGICSAPGDGTSATSLSSSSSSSAAGNQIFERNLVTSVPTVVAPPSRPLSKFKQRRMEQGRDH
uniref:Unconventional prefoldin RPB5 interactor n=1 Tax=Polytomella parva TaxID=51329 RepID=A0A6U0TFL4_9CHLO|mmetsp:Transcript_1125/g.1644  ORF Transcript_1125/g.1644 Transcript_1125/m.1644 type:complete len:464 (+) Transcript_1125:459-1850(+)|eukprot:CAMPEP_0175085434 /NCGR_PEP_ID=MMETSP0052_2-20121109/28661_1 /TAXON_ID=51329 ORGANISM="Polytomella parva, Strain SAG 63-3" /NCGR_SAMPLE_ID=MMETSP0052_2 /ASSEMBLY_ACC=CAM_ASM_000194 /LENGTH=463 /DNA_ID=CAMNT_0016357445 /DNA_START=503 /DNA_END=1894 /DNA_ORIENTATION=+